MSKLYQILAVLCIIYFADILAKPQPSVSYIDDIELSYNNGIWQCDKLTCPSGTFGCKVLRKNFPNMYGTLQRVNICYNEKEETMLENKWLEVLSKIKNVNVDVNTFIGADTMGVSGYGDSYQTVVYTTDVKDWKNIQVRTRNMMKNVDGKGKTFESEKLVLN